MKALLSLLLVLGAIGIETALAAETCEGEIRNTHRLGTAHFATTSRVYAGNGVHVYETCVENLGEGDLWINWMIPGPVSYVPKGKAVVSSRPFLTRETIDAIACLEYGNLAEMLREKYLGHAFDQNALSEERDLGCQPKRSASVDVTAGGSPNFVEVPVRLFVASDRDRPESTMIEINAIASAKWSPGFFPIQMLMYSAVPVRLGSLANPDDMTIRLAKGANTEILYADKAASTLLGGVPLGTKNEFGFAVETSREPILKSARYEVLDQNGKLVGSFLAPVWLPKDSY